MRDWGCRHQDAPATPATLRLAPQLGVLAVLDETITIAVYALLAEHPKLASQRPIGTLPPDHSPESQLLRCLQRASHLLADYRAAVAQLIADLDDTSVSQNARDDPF